MIVLKFLIVFISLLMIIFGGLFTAVTYKESDGMKKNKGEGWCWNLNILYKLIENATNKNHKAQEGGLEQKIQYLVPSL